MHDENQSLPKYSKLAKALHWSVAVLIVVQLVIGWTMPDVHKDTQPG